MSIHLGGRAGRTGRVHREARREPESHRPVARVEYDLARTELLVARLQANASFDNRQAANGRHALGRDVHIADVENRLQERLGTKVALRYRQGKGSVDIKFFSDDELERILQIVGVKLD